MKTKLFQYQFFYYCYKKCLGFAHRRTNVPRVRYYSFHSFQSSRGKDSETPLDKIFLSIFIIFFLGIFFLSAITVISQLKETKAKLLVKEKEKRNILDRIKLEEARAIKKRCLLNLECTNLRNIEKKVKCIDYQRFFKFILANQSLYDFIRHYV